MRAKKLVLTAMGFITLSCASSTFAIMSVPFGWYLEGNIGTTKITDQTLPGSTSTSYVGGNANIGYKFMPFFGLEIGYTQYANTNIKNFQGVNAATVRHFAWDIAARGILPFADTGVEAVAKLGAARANSRTSIDNSQAAASIGLTGSNHSGTTGVYLAIGGQYYLSPEVAVIAQWARAQGNTSTGTLDLYSIGASFTVMNF